MRYWSGFKVLGLAVSAITLSFSPIYPETRLESQYGSLIILQVLRWQRVCEWKVTVASSVSMMLTNPYQNIRATCTYTLEYNRKEVQCTTWRMHSRTGQLVETQDDYFCRLSSWSAPTRLVTVLWIGYIKTIK